MFPISDSGRGPETFPKIQKRTLYHTHKSQSDYYRHSQYYPIRHMLHHLNPIYVNNNLPDEEPVTCLGAPGCLNC